MLSEPTATPNLLGQGSLPSDGVSLLRRGETVGLHLCARGESQPGPGRWRTAPDSLLAMVDGPARGCLTMISTCRAKAPAEFAAHDLAECCQFALYALGIASVMRHAICAAEQRKPQLRHHVEAVRALPNQ